MMNRLPRPNRLIGGLAALFFWFLTTSAARAGGYIQQWMHGSVILTSGDTIDGPVAYHHDEETLEIRLRDGTVRTLPAINVSYFIVANEIKQKLGYSGPMMVGPGYYSGYPYRGAGWSTPRTDTSRIKLYVTYLWNQGNDYSDFKAPAFFQQLTDGNIRLLKRERIVERMISPVDPFYRYSAFPMNGGYYTEIQNTYFLADPQGNLTQLRSIKRDFLAYFGKANGKLIQTYAKENRLSFSEPRELLLIMRYADSLGRG